MRNATMTPTKPIQVGDKLTVISIDDFMALSHRHEIQITRLIDGKLVYKHKGKRKEYYLRLDKEQIILTGWDLCKVDNEVGHCFSGNACFNIVHESKEALIEMLETKTVCELSEDVKSKVMLCLKEDLMKGNLDSYLPVYPDIDTTHAVVTRYREQALSKAE